MTTRRQVIAGLRAELAKRELSPERRAELQGALDHQLETLEAGGSENFTSAANAAAPRPSAWSPLNRQTDHRSAQVSDLGSAQRTPSRDYNAHNCVAAQRPNFAPIPANTPDTQRVLILKAQHKVALQWVTAFTLRANTNNTQDGRRLDETCRDEWAAFARELATEITRTRNRVRQAARRAR